MSRTIEGVLIAPNGTLLTSVPITFRALETSLPGVPFTSETTITTHPVTAAYSVTLENNTYQVTATIGGVSSVLGIGVVTDGPNITLPELLSVSSVPESFAMDLLDRIIALENGGGSGGLPVLGPGPANEITTANAAGTALARSGFTIAALLAAARDRATHTGTQLAATISNFASSVLALLTWANISDKPSSFTPSAHAATHATGGSDPITPASIGADDAGTPRPPTAHSHVTGDITGFAADSRAQVEAMLLAGANITLTPSGAGATRQITIAASGGGGGGSPGGSNGQVQYRVDASTFGGAPLWRESANVSAFRNGTNAQVVYVYRTESGSGANYERIAVDCTNSDYMRMAVESAGTGAANIGLALVPRGNGALTAHLPDSTAAGGNARGAYAVDLQRNRTSASQVASGSDSVICGGYANTASGSQSAVLGGQSCTASGQWTVVCGGRNNTSSGSFFSAVLSGDGNTSSATASVVSGGRENTASGQDSWIPGGRSSLTRGLTGAFSYSSASRAANGDAQRIGQPLQITTSNATATVLTADRAAVSSQNVMVLPNNSAWSGLVQVLARDTSGNVAKWTFDVLAKRDASAASTAIVHNTTVVSHTDSALSAVVVAIVADTTQGAVTVQVTGIAGTTIDWWAEASGGQIVR